MVGLESINPTRLGVDEIAYHKRHEYLTVVRDLTLKRVIWVGVDRKKETLNKFFKGLGESRCSRIRVIYGIPA